MAIKETDNRKDCCKEEDNMRLVEENATKTGILQKFRCVLCNRNHYVAFGRPAKIGISGKAL